MSRLRFLANHDYTEAILLGVKRREPTIEVVRLREVGLDGRPDAEVLEYAAARGFIVLSHDVNTMTAHAYERTGIGLPMPGLFVSHQHDSIGDVIENLILLWAASEAEEWAGCVEFLPLR